MSLMVVGTGCLVPSSLLAIVKTRPLFGSAPSSKLLAQCQVPCPPGPQRPPGPPPRRVAVAAANWLGVPRPSARGCPPSTGWPRNGQHGGPPGRPTGGGRAGPTDPGRPRGGTTGWSRPALSRVLEGAHPLHQPISEPHLRRLAEVPRPRAPPAGLERAARHAGKGRATWRVGEFVLPRPD